MVTDFLQHSMPEKVSYFAFNWGNGVNVKTDVYGKSLAEVVNRVEVEVVIGYNTINQSNFEQIVNKSHQAERVNFRSSAILSDSECTFDDSLTFKIKKLCFPYFSSCNSPSVSVRKQRLKNIINGVLECKPLAESLACITVHNSNGIRVSEVAEWVAAKSSTISVIDENTDSSI